MTEEINESYSLLRNLAGNLMDEVNSEWLLERSIVDPRCVSASDFLHKLYGGRYIKPEKIRISYSSINNNQRNSIIWPNDGFENSSHKGVWFFPQPVDVECSVLKWRYIVFKNTWAPPFTWLAAIAQILPQITSITTSGKNKLHVLSKIDATSLEDFEFYISKLGELKKIGTHICSPMEMTRLPGCFRNVKGHMREQKLLFFDPTGTDLTLNDLHVRRLI
jgi:hypothetical protein